MDSLLLLILLLGGTPDRPSIDARRSEAQAVASVRILRGAAVDLAAPPANHRRQQATGNDKRILQMVPLRSTAAMQDMDGRTIQLQEFP